MILAFVGASILGIHNFALQQNQIRVLINQDVSLEGVASTDSSKTRSRVIGSRSIGSRTTFIMRVERIALGGANPSTYKTRIPIRVVISDSISAIPGERIRISGRILPTEERKVVALLIGRSHSFQSINKPNALLQVESIRTALRAGAERIGGDSSSLIPGMVIGDTSLQSEPFSTLMLDAGLSHLTAVSGANFAIVTAFIFTLVGILTPRRKLQVFITICALSIFVILVRPTPSVLRAAVMALLFMLAKFSGRMSVASNALAAAVAILLLINPYQAFEAGFVLSVLATAGLIFSSSHIADRIPGPRALGELVAVPVAATLYCTPYLLFLSGRLNLGSIVMNIAVAPAVPFVTITGFLATVSILPIPFIAHFLLELADLGAKWIVFVANWNDSMPTLLTSPVVVLILLLVIFLIRNLESKWIVLSVTVLMIVGSNQRLLFANSNWVVAQCDVGQGDALLINLGEHSAMLFDAGPDPRLLDRCLDLFGVRQLPLIVITHSHADHYQGLAGVKGRSVGEVWSNHEFDELTEMFPSIRVARAGLEAEIGPAKVEILWPVSGEETFESVTGDGSVENNRSIVALIEIEGRELLVTGDIEPGAQSELLKNFATQLKRVDLIKVPHHGSKHQEMQLFEAASVYLISVGQNSYGHPDKGLVGQLGQRGRVFRTDRDGQISLNWKEGHSEPIFSARTLGKEWWRISWQ